MKAKGAGEWPPRNANGGIAVWGSGLTAYDKDGDKRVILRLKKEQL